MARIQSEVGSGIISVLHGEHLRESKCGDMGSGNVIHRSSSRSKLPPSKLMDFVVVMVGV